MLKYKIKCSWRIILKYKVGALVAGVFFTVSTLASSSLLFAQSSQNLSGYLISPVRVETTLEKGQTETVTLTLENVTDITATVKAIVNDFEPSDDESGQPKILLEENATAQGNSFKSLVQPIAPVTLAAKEKKEIPVTITIPENSSAGGYYGAVRFATDSNEPDGNVALSASVGTIFLVTVPGDLTEQLELIEMTAAKNGSTGRFFLGTGNFSVVTRLENTGNIHVKPFGKVIITNGSGDTVEEYEFNDNNPRDNVLPGSTRKFEDQLKGDYGFGKYTIKANLGYGNGSGLITVNQTFWVIPVWVLIVAIAAIVLVVVGGIILYNKLKKSRKHKVSPRR
jgi:hypothetical protein